MIIKKLTELSLLPGDGHPDFFDHPLEASLGTNTARRRFLNQELTYDSETNDSLMRIPFSKS